MLGKRSKVDNNLATGKARGKLFYGWVVAIAGAIVLLAAGNFHYSFGVLLKPIISKFGWSRGVVSGCVSGRSIVSGVIAPIVGSLSDRYGTRRFILIGIILVGTSYLLSSQISSLWHLYLLLSVLLGTGLGIMYTPLMATATRWFGGKSALANGIVLSGFGMGQILVPPAATYILLQYGWETCFITLGIAALGLGTLAWSFVRNPPQSIVSPPLPESASARTPANDDYTLSEASHTLAFRILFLIQLLDALCYLMVAIHIVAAATDVGISPGAAAIILTLSGITNTVGRLAMGGLATKIGNKTVLALCLAMQAPILFLLAGASDLQLFYIIATVYGLVHGGISPIIITLSGSLFGTRSVGGIIGALTLGLTTGVAIGPLLAGYIFDVTGSYSIAFSSAAIATAIAFLLCLLLKPPGKKATAT